MFPGTEATSHDPPLLGTRFIAQDHGRSSVGGVFVGRRNSFLCLWDLPLSLLLVAYLVHVLLQHQAHSTSCM